MALQTYLTFLLACVVVIIVPGPTVTLIIANSLRHGRRAGLLNVAGTQVGLGIMVVVVMLGLASLVAALGEWFFWIRLAGAAYLIWLGWKLLSASGAVTKDGAPAMPRGGFFAQGLAVALSNPKTLLFFGAFFPQFLDPGRDFSTQVSIMGGTAMALAALSDSTYALLSSRAGRALSQRRIRFITRASGGFLIGGGAWLALSRSK
ncbi:MAG TPA: LysE family translocator [Magnetospirillaceae bacterium]|jgi:threonine/homoserine/homoserine lactone efflux protein